jgi:REP element-mobilizing transposase RayT
VHAQFVSFAKLGQDRGIAVGRYVIMPDHIHLFVSGSQEFLLTQWVRLMKRSLSKVIFYRPRHTGRRAFSTISFAIERVTPRNGNTCDRIRSVQGWSQSTKGGHGKVSS